MTAQRRRIMKEARALFWPWFVVTSIGALAWLLPVQPQRFPLSVGFWLGIPLLATLSLGAEFYSRTFELLLSQPAARSRMWIEKFVVVMIAAPSSSVFYWLEWRKGFTAAAALWMVVTVSSATYWTLVARSTTGGLILNLFQVILFVFALVIVPIGFAFEGHPVPAAAGSLPVVLCTLTFAAVMLWLGWRKLASFQADGRSAENDLLTVSPHLARVTIDRLLRSRQHQPVLNLIRKEMRLLWPVWFLTAFTILFLVLMTPFRSTSAGYVSLHRIAFGVIGVYGLLTALLSGVLSMGEERTCGSLSWHLTLPISVRRQWLIKLGIAMLSSFVCIRLVLALGTLLLGGLFADLANELLYVIMGAGAALTFAAFWSACAIRGTVAAALWTFPVAFTVFVAGPLGLNLMEWTRDAAVFNYLVSQLPPFSGMFPLSTDNVMLAIVRFGGTALAWLTIPSILLALMQSYRLFRREAGEGARSIVPHLVPLVLLGVVAGIGTAILPVLSYQTRIQYQAVLREVHTQSPTLSDTAMRWLAGAEISMTTENRINIRFRNGWQCTNTAGLVTSNTPDIWVFYRCTSQNGQIIPVFFRL